MDQNPVWRSMPRETRVGKAGRRIARGLVYAAILALCATAAMAQSPPSAAQLPTSSEVTNLARHGFFFAGGNYVGDPDKQVMDGQMYVEVLVPREIRRKYPLVLIHGAAQTATNWMLTPDARQGWAAYFVAQGYTVYMVDQPARGRSAYHPGIDGPIRAFTAQSIEQLFTAPEHFGKWPQAKTHTQWPGDGEHKGHIGDPVFDAFYATQVEYLEDNAVTQRLVQAAAAALLDRIGPAIVLTHSQSGPFGWLIADARPDKVKAILAIEPAGPPFENVVVGNGKARAWGVTDIPITYEPPVTDPAELRLDKPATAEAPDLVACWRQTEPARRLTHLQNIPILLVTSEASYHAGYDHCTARYLDQAGAKTDFERLADRGIRGNGHMMMLEKNNLAIAKLLDDWVQANVR